MREMDYGELIRRPFEIVARRPYLWLLGFLAGGAAAFNFPGSGPSYGRSASPRGYHGPSWTGLQSIWNANWEWIVGVLAFFAVAGILLFVLGCIATGGIIHASVEHDAGREHRLGAAWRAGYATGWRIAGLRLLVFLLALAPGLLFGAFVLAAVAGATSSIAAAFGFGLLAALTLLASIVCWLVLGVAYQLAQRLIVLEDGHVAASLTDGLRMIRWHLKEVTFGWLISIAISIVAGIAVAVFVVVAAIAIGIPAGLLGFGGWLVAGAAAAIVIGSVAGVFFLGIVLAASGAYAAYSSVYWTLLFTRIRSLPAPAARGAMAPAA